MQKFKIGVAYEEGFSIEVEADTIDDARVKAFDLIDQYASVKIDNHQINPVHRDYHLVEV